MGGIMKDLIFTIKFYFNNAIKNFRHIVKDLAEYVFYVVKAFLLFPFAKMKNVKAQLAIAEIIISKNWKKYAETINKFIGEEIIVGWVFTAALEKNSFALVLQGIVYEKKANEVHKSIFSVQNGDKKFYAQIEKDEKALLKASLDSFKEASELNYPVAKLHCYRIKDFYGVYVELTEEEALEYLKCSAENNLPNAQFLYGNELLKDDKFNEGFSFIEKSAKAKKAMWSNNITSYGNRKKAIQWYKKNKNLVQIVEDAFSGKAQAMFEYSEYLLEDSHKNDSLRLSHKWHTKSARAGYPKAMAEEGYFIIHGWVDATLEEAFDYFQKAVNAGYKKAHYGLGDCYLHGWGVEQNYEKAKYHYKKIRMGYKLKGITAQNIKEKIDGDQALKNDRDFYN